VKSKAAFLAVILVLVSVASFGFANQAFSENYTAGLGISDYEANTNVTIGESKQFEIARLSNEGTLDLIVTATWIPDFNATDAGIEFRFYPDQVNLTVGSEPILFYGDVVKANALGTYEGHIQFSTAVQLPEGYGGNPSVPGGSAKVTVNIVSSSVQFGVSVDPGILLSVLGFGIGALVTVVVGFKIKNRRQRAT